MSDTSYELTTDYEETDHFRVCVFARPDDPETVVAVLMSVLELNRIDARIYTRGIPGLLPGRFREETAVQLVSRIRELGINAAALPEPSVPKLDRHEVIHRAACLESGFEVSGLTGSRRALIAWRDVELISLGWLPLEPVRHFNVESQTVVFSAPHSGNERIDVVSAFGPEVLCLTQNPQHVYRFDQDHMNYEYLGSRMTDSATTNFRMFFKDLTARATSAYLTPATREFLAHGNVDHMRFADSKELRDATLLHAVLHHQQQRMSR